MGANFLIYFRWWQIKHIPWSIVPPPHFLDLFSIEHCTHTITSYFGQFSWTGLPHFSSVPKHSASSSKIVSLSNSSTSSSSSNKSEFSLNLLHLKPSHSNIFRNTVDFRLSVSVLVFSIHRQMMPRKQYCFAFPSSLSVLMVSLEPLFLPKGHFRVLIVFTHCMNMRLLRKCQCE